MNIKPMVRNIMLATAVTAGSLTALSVFRTPGQKLVSGNPEKVHITYNDYVKSLLYPNERDALSYEWDQNASIADNVMYNLYGPTFDRAKIAMQQFTDKVVDPLSKSPIVPAATLLVSSVGAKALKPKEDEIPEEVKENGSAQENNIDIYS